MLKPLDIYKQLVKRGQTWADALEIAEIYEENKKSLLSQLGTECEEKSSAAREAYALRHVEYIKHIEDMVKARKAANKARVIYDSARIYAELKRTEAATERAINKYSS